MDSAIEKNTSYDAVEASGLRKNLSGIIDAALVIALFILGTSFLPQAIQNILDKPIRQELYLLLALALYRLLFIFLFNGTPGMFIARIKLLNENLQRLSVKEKIFASFFILIDDTAYYNR